MSASYLSSRTTEFSASGKTGAGYACNVTITVDQKISGAMVEYCDETALEVLKTAYLEAKRTFEGNKR